MNYGFYYKKLEYFMINIQINKKINEYLWDMIRIIYGILITISNYFFNNYFKIILLNMDSIFYL